MLDMEKCFLCPRMCAADRSKAVGVCGSPENIKAARAALHFWEEPCISGKNGSAAVFFSGCQLKCVYCQNFNISHNSYGKEITVDRLADIFDELCDMGAHNINLVSPTPYTRHILAALEKRKSNIPVVWNSSGYERIETLKMLDGAIDIYLPDIKYSDNELSKKLSAAPDYFETATAAVKEMFRQRGKARIDRNGIMQSGVLIRHLLLPGMFENTRGVADFIADTFAPGDVIFSLLGQYTPTGMSSLYTEINRPVTKEEYDWAVSYCTSVGAAPDYTQNLSSADSEYIPDFDCTGL